MAADPERNVAHQRDAGFPSLSLHAAPLGESEPLDVPIERHGALQFRGPRGLQPTYPLARGLWTSLMLRPFLPFGGSAIRIQQGAKENIVGQPFALLRDELPEVLRSGALLLYRGSLKI